MESNSSEKEGKLKQFQLLFNWIILILFTIFIFDSLFWVINLMYNENQNLLPYLLFLSLSIIGGPIIVLLFKKYAPYRLIMVLIGIFFLIFEILSLTWTFLRFMEILLYFSYLTLFNICYDYSNKKENLNLETLVIVGILIGFFIPSFSSTPNNFEFMKFIYLIILLVIISLFGYIAFIKFKESTDWKKKQKIQNLKRFNKLFIRNALKSLLKSILILVFVILSAFLSYILFYIVHDIVLRSLLSYSIMGCVFIDILVLMHRTERSRTSYSNIGLGILINLLLTFMTFFLTIQTGMGYLIGVYQVIISLLTLGIISINTNSFLKRN